MNQINKKLDPEQDRLPCEQCYKCYSYDATEGVCDEWGKPVDINGWCELYDTIGGTNGKSTL
jgi:hypothetical protein